MLDDLVILALSRLAYDGSLDFQKEHELNYNHYDRYYLHHYDVY